MEDLDRSGGAFENQLVHPARRRSLESGRFLQCQQSPLNIDLGSRQYLDLDQNPVLGSLWLEPYSSKSWWITAKLR